jgi:hypothetical protein
MRREGNKKATTIDYRPLTIKKCLNTHRDVESELDGLLFLPNANTTGTKWPQRRLLY